MKFQKCTRHDNKTPLYDSESTLSSIFSCFDNFHERKDTEGKKYGYPNYTVAWEFMVLALRISVLLMMSTVIYHHIHCNDTA